MTHIVSASWKWAKNIGMIQVIANICQIGLKLAERIEVGCNVNKANDLVWWSQIGCRGFEYNVKQGSFEASNPLDLLCLDFTAVDPSRDGKENILVTTDIFSNFTVAEVTPNQQAKTVVGCPASYFFELVPIFWKKFLFFQQNL